MQYRFNEIFKENNGQLQPTRQIRVGAIEFSPDAKFRYGASIGGIDFYQFKDHEIEAEEKDNVLIIRGIY